MEYQAKEHMIAALRKGVRLDGRKLDEFRKITIEVNGIRNAEGSAQIRCGECEMISGVKLAIGTPYPDRPASGTLMVNAELLPISNPDFESGPPSIDSIETSRVIDRGIRESKSIDEEKLCITAGEKVWMANIDICPINSDGNLIDIGGLASIVALHAARFPTVKDGLPNYKELSDEKLPVGEWPIPITVCKLGDILIVDPTHDEWKMLDARLTVTTLEDGTLCAMQKGGEGSLTLEEIKQMIAIAVEKGKELRKIGQAALTA